MSLGFSFIEVLCAIGILALLAGLLVPMIRQSWYRARVTRSSLHLQQNATLIAQYVHDWKEVYPVASPNAFQSMLAWYRPLYETGLLSRNEDADVDAFSRVGSCSFALSLSTVLDPALMQPGRTAPADAMPSRGIRPDQIPFPSAKGTMNQFLVYYAPGGKAFWAATRPLIAPAQFADGSGEEAAWNRYRYLAGPRGECHTENGVGLPITSSWEGFMARDR